MKKPILALTITALMALPAHADDDKSIKVELGGGLMQYGEADSTAVFGRANITLPIVDRAFDIGVEVEAGSSIQASDAAVGRLISIDGIEREVFISVNDFGVQEHMAGFFIFRVPLESGLGISVRAGYHQSNFGGERLVEVPELGTSDLQVFDIDFEGPAAGLSGEYFFGKAKKNGVRFDLTWHDTGDVDIDGGSTWAGISYMRRF